MKSWINEFRYNMKKEDFGIKEDPMPTADRANFLLSNPDKLPSIEKLHDKHKSKRK
jgi:hypothetical protein